MSSTGSSLRRLLWVDAVTCAVTGLLLIIGSDLIAHLTRIPGRLFFYAGIVLLPVAAFMALTAARRPIPVFAAALVIFGNVLWVLGSLALFVIPSISPNALGSAFIAVQAAIVLLLALLEWQTLGNETLGHRGLNPGVDARLPQRDTE